MKTFTRAILQRHGEDVEVEASGTLSREINEFTGRLGYLVEEVRAESLEDLPHIGISTGDSLDLSYTEESTLSDKLVEANNK